MATLGLSVPAIMTHDQEPQLSSRSGEGPSINQPDEVALGDVLADDYLRSVFEKPMKEASGPWQPHREAWVLTISWADELDDLKTCDEVRRLSNVFSEKFNYGVVQARIEKNDSLPQQQVQRDLANFVCEHDRPGHFLIVYYAGHGMKGPPGQLNLTAASKIKDKITERNAVPWHEVESLVRATRADVLTIFDCCYAGNLCGRSLYRRNFEFLAATRDGTTPVPGDTSFTSALIWALEKLAANNTPFSTTELMHQIIHRAPHFPRKQVPILIPRFELSDRRLMLAPITKSGEFVYSERPRPVYGQSADLQGTIKQSVDLRFFFDGDPTEDIITRLSMKMKELRDEDDFPVSHISWVGPCSRDLVRNVAKKWLSIIASRRAIPTSPEPTSAILPTTPISLSPQDYNGDVLTEADNAARTQPKRKLEHTPESTPRRSKRVKPS